MCLTTLLWWFWIIIPLLCYFPVCLNFSFELPITTFPSFSTISVYFWYALFWKTYLLSTLSTFLLFPEEYLYTFQPFLKRICQFGHFFFASIYWYYMYRTSSDFQTLPRRPPHTSQASITVLTFIDSACPHKNDDISVKPTLYISYQQKQEPLDVEFNVSGSVTPMFHFTHKSMILRELRQWISIMFLVRLFGQFCHLSNVRDSLAITLKYML